MSESIYELISNAVIDGNLPKDFRLPKPDDEQKAMFADGALDGVGMYHMNVPEMTEDDRELMESAVRAASDANYEIADRLFGKLGERMQALFVIDERQA